MDTYARKPDFILACEKTSEPAWGQGIRHTLLQWAVRLSAWQAKYLCCKVWRMCHMCRVPRSSLHLKKKKKKSFPSLVVLLAKKLNVSSNTLVAIHSERKPFQLPPDTHIFRDFFFFFDSAWVSTEKPGTNCLEQLFHQAAFGREMRVPNSLNILKIL